MDFDHRLTFSFALRGSSIRRSDVVFSLVALFGVSDLSVADVGAVAGFGFGVSTLFRLVVIVFGTVWCCGVRLFLLGRFLCILGRLTGRNLLKYYFYSDTYKMNSKFSPEDYK